MSSYTKIVNYAAKDALVEGDPNKIIKGTELDAEFVAIQNAVGAKADLQSPAFTGAPTAPDQVLGDSSFKIANTRFVMQNAIPVGGIIMWSGIISTIPTGWALCNGSNGTPDLRDKFIIGAGSTYSPSNTGGAATVTLLEANLPAHTHGAGTYEVQSGGSHTHAVTDPGHYHSMSMGGYQPSSTQSYQGTSGYNNGTGQNTNSGQTNISIGTAAAHTHTLSGASASVGSGTAVNILPPYLALAYIMRTA